MSRENGVDWRIISTTTAPTDKNGWIQVERLEQGNAYLRAGWQRSNLFGVNSRNVGSYVYADKTSPVEFILEDIDAEADGIGEIENGEWRMDDGGIRSYNLSGQPVAPGYRGIVIQRQPNGTARKLLVK